MNTYYFTKKGVAGMMKVINQHPEYAEPKKKEEVLRAVYIKVQKMIERNRQRGEVIS